MKQFTLGRTDDGWFVGRLKEMPAVMQGATLEELQRMIRDATV